MTKRLYPKYMVYRILASAGDLVESTVSKVGIESTNPDDIDSSFVLLPRKDPAAYYALLHYAQVCEPALAREIRVWLEKVIKAPPEYGTQGERNRVAMKLKQMEIIL